MSEKSGANHESYMTGDFEHIDELQADIRQSQEDTEDVSQQTKSVGEEYFEKSFKPHPELPTELPEEIGSYIKGSQKELWWYLMQSGIGNVIMPGFGFESDASRVALYLDGQQEEALREDTADNFFNHMVNNFNTYFSSIGSKIKDIVIARPDLETAKSELSDLFSNSNTCYQAYERMTKSSREKVQSINKEEESEVNKALTQYSERLDQDPEDREAFDGLIETAKKHSEMTGMDWYGIAVSGYAASLRDNPSVLEKIKQLLSDDEKVVFTDLLDTYEPYFRSHRDINSLLNRAGALSKDYIMNNQEGLN